MVGHNNSKRRATGRIPIYKAHRECARSIVVETVGGLSASVTLDEGARPTPEGARGDRLRYKGME